MLAAGTGLKLFDFFFFFFFWGGGGAYFFYFDRACLEMKRLNLCFVVFIFCNIQCKFYYK